MPVHLTDGCFTGSFLHLAKPTGLSCPNQNILIKSDPNWKKLTKLGMLDPEAENWKIQYLPIYIMDFPVEDKVKLKLALTRDTVNNDILGAGALYRQAEMYNGGTYKVSSFILFSCLVHKRMIDIETFTSICKACCMYISREIYGVCGILVQ